MNFKFKLQLTFYILFLQLAFVALFQTQIVNTAVYQIFLKQSQKLQNAFLDETIKNQFKASYIYDSHNHRFHQTFGFMLQNLLSFSKSSRDLDTSAQEIQQFLQSLLARNIKMNIQINCDNGFTGTINQTATFEGLPSYNILNIQVYEQKIRYLLGFEDSNQQFCSIQVLNYMQSISYFQQLYTKSYSNFLLLEDEIYQFKLDGLEMMQKIDFLSLYGDNILEDIITKLNEEYCDKYIIVSSPNFRMAQSNNLYQIYWSDLSLYDEQCQLLQDKRSVFLTIVNGQQYSQQELVIDQHNDETFRLVVIEAIAVAIFAFYIHILSVRVASSYCYPLMKLQLSLQSPMLVQFERLPDQFQQQNCEDLVQLFKFVELFIYQYQLLHKSYQYWDKDHGALCLLTLSQTKQLYKLCKNNWQVSVCANNIAQIHFNNKRYMEALTQQAESVILGFKEYASIKQLEKIRQQLIKNETNAAVKLKNQITRYVINKFAGGSIVLQTDQFHLKRSRRLSICVGSQKAVYLNIFSERQMNVQQQHKKTNTLDNILMPDEEMKNTLDRSIVKNEKIFVKQTILYRKFQFAQMLYKFCMKERPILLNEAIVKLEEVNRDIVNSNFCESRNITAMRFIILIQKFHCFEKLQLLNQAKLEFLDIKFMYKKYINSSTVQGLQNGIDIFHNIPPKLFQNYIWRLKAYIHMEDLKFYEAGRQCLKIIQNSNNNAFGLQSYAYKMLLKIFKFNYLNLDILANLHHQLFVQQCSISFFIDYSSKISSEQIQLSHSICQYIVANLAFDNQVGLYIFNEVIFEIFPYQKISNYQQIIESQFERFLMIKGGKCKIYKCFLELLQHQVYGKKTTFNQKQFEKKVFKQSTTNIKMLKSYSLSNRYVCIFSEFSSKVSDILIDKINEMIEDNDINVIIFNIANSNYNRDKAYKFSQKIGATLIESEFETVDWVRQLGQVKPEKKQYIEFL